MKKIAVTMLLVLLLTTVLTGAAFAGTDNNTTIYYVDGKAVDKVTFEKALYEWQFAVPHYDVIFNLAVK
ncbi:MAG: hypothetical protein ACUVTU_02105 [Desulfurispora sp.]|uniref:hypothetical protein n=1 Tax=Desulfurispora sp. TaxID=3014275 RepID=UPI00404B3367